MLNVSQEFGGGIGLSKGGKLEEKSLSFSRLVARRK